MKNLLKIIGCILILVGCQNNVSTEKTSSSEFKEDVLTSSLSSSSMINSGSEKNLLIEKVQILYEGVKDVFSSSHIKLDCLIQSNMENNGVEWTTSDENLAKIENGKVVFGSTNDAKGKEVVISAISKDDESKFDSIVFTVWPKDSNLHMYIFDNESGESTYENGHSSLVIENLYSNHFYVEAKMWICSLNDTDRFARGGIMIGTDPLGYYNVKGRKNVFWSLDINSSSSKTFNKFDLITQNSYLNDWDWDYNSIKSSIIKEESYEIFEEFKIGIYRMNNKFIVYAGSDKNYKARGIYELNSFDSYEKTYVWFGGWSNCFQVANVVYLENEAADAYNLENL